MVFNFMYGLFFGAKNDANKDSSQDHDSRRIKITAPQMTEFSGSTSEWKKWKARTKNVFYSTGYGDIISSKDDAIRRDEDNKTVYTLLNTATIDGTASHLVTRYGDDMDGFGAWKALEEWYDNVNRQATNAEVLRDTLQDTKLYTGNRCDMFINTFFKTYHELNKIEGEHISENHAVKLFLKNILDPDYKTTVQSIETMEICDLATVVEKIRNRASTISNQRKNTKRLRAHIRRMQHHRASGTTYESDEDDGISTNDYQPVRKKVRQQSIRRLSGTVETTEKGLLSFPNRDWIALTDEEKAFVQAYNSRVKHNEPVDDIQMPNGLIIKSKARRVPSRFSDPAQSMPTPQRDNVAPPTSGKSSTKQRKEPERKKIRFDLENDPAADESDSDEPST